MEVRREGSGCRERRNVVLLDYSSWEQRKVWEYEGLGGWAAAFIGGQGKGAKGPVHLRR